METTRKPDIFLEDFPWLCRHLGGANFGLEPTVASNSRNREGKDAKRVETCQESSGIIRTKIGSTKTSDLGVGQGMEIAMV
jgi:hypothetical protein